MIEINVPDSDIVERISGRRTHPASGRSYHVRFNPPKQEGKDDITGEDLVHRDDDKEETVKKRLEVYQKQTQPLVEYYSQKATDAQENTPSYIKVSGIGKVDEISQRIFKALEQ